MIINKNLLDQVSEQAKASPRLRMNYNFHQSLEDKCHRFLNAVEPGTKVEIHRHPTKDESFVLLRGRLIEEYYDGQSKKCIESIELSPNGPVFALNIPAGQWHTVRALESGTVILEMKDGAYIPTSQEDILDA